MAWSFQERGVYMAEFIMDIVLGIVLLAFAILGGQIPQLSSPNDIVEASGFPIIFSVIGLLLLAVEVIDQIKKKKKSGKAESVAQSSFDPRKAYKVIAIVTMTILFILTSKWIGFFTFSLVFCFVSLNLLGSRNQKFNVIFTVAVVLVLTVVFGRFFGIILPRGQWFFKKMSYLLY